MPDLATKVEDLRWVADGISRKVEYWAVRGLIKLADAGHLDRFIEEPWVVEGRNYPALWNLAFSNISFDPSEVYSWVIDHPALKDGISEREAKILATVGVPSDADLLDDDAVIIEERAIALPLAGEVELTIIWTSSVDDAAMDAFEQSVRRIEATMGLPFPQRQVIYKIDLDGPDFGYRASTHVAISGFSDPANLSYVIAHEAAHFYWTSPVASWTSADINYRWVYEGAAEFLALLENDVSFDVVPGSVCDRNIAEVEELPSDGPKCWWYFLGHWFYSDLYRIMDESNFRMAFRRWLLHTLHNSAVCSGDGTTYCRVMEAFTTNALEDNRARVEDLINRWYGMRP